MHYEHIISVRNGVYIFRANCHHSLRDFAHCGLITLYGLLVRVMASHRIVTTWLNDDRSIRIHKAQVKYQQYAFYSLFISAIYVLYITTLKIYTLCLPQQFLCCIWHYPWLCCKKTRTQLSRKKIMLTSAHMALSLLVQYWAMVQMFLRYEHISRKQQWTYPIWKVYWCYVMMLYSSNLVKMTCIKMIRILLILPSEQISMICKPVKYQNKPIPNWRQASMYCPHIVRTIDTCLERSHTTVISTHWGEKEMANIFQNPSWDACY